jgi:hypothetical protein
MENIMEKELNIIRKKAIKDGFLKTFDMFDNVKLGLEKDYDVNKLKDNLQKTKAAFNLKYVDLSLKLQEKHNILSSENIKKILFELDHELDKYKIQTDLDYKEIESKQKQYEKDMLNYYNIVGKTMFFTFLSSILLLSGIFFLLK